MKHLISVFITLLILTTNAIARNNNQNKPNVLLIIVDDMGYADYGRFKRNDSGFATPNMNRIADAGIAFTQAYTSAPVCSPSRCGIHTGKNQFRWDTKAGWNPGLPENTKTIAEYLKEAGYTTACIGKSDFGKGYFKFDDRAYPLNHGYDQFLGFSAHAHDYWLSSEQIAKRTPDHLKKSSAHLGPLMHNNGYKSYDEGYLTDIFTDEAIKFLNLNKEKPFFLTLSYNAVHHIIHEVPEKYLKKYNVKSIHNYDPDNMETFNGKNPGLYSSYYEKYTRLGAIQDEDMRKYYLANLNCLDDNIGRLLDAMTKQKINRNTLIVFVSDNGGSPLTGANNKPLTAGKYSIWEGGIRVPLAISWPEKIEGGKIENSYVSALDILPTILSATGIKPKDKHMDGINLLKPKSDRILVWKWQKNWAIRKGDFKLTNTNEESGKGRPSNQYKPPIFNDHSLKLFDLKNDQEERNNLAPVMPEKVNELKMLFEQWCADNLEKY